MRRNHLELVGAPAARLAIGLAPAGMSVGGMTLYMVVNRIMDICGFRVGYALVRSPIVLLTLPLVL